jgi:hypothetical protein
MEEFFNTDAFHYDASTNTVLNIIRIIAELNTLRLPSVSNNVEFSSVFLEEGALLSGAITRVICLLNGIFSTLSNVSGEDVLGVVEIAAELVVVDLSSAALVAVTANKQIIMVLAGRHQTKRFENAQELLGSYVQ